MKQKLNVLFFLLFFVFSAKAQFKRTYSNLPIIKDRIEYMNDIFEIDKRQFYENEEIFEIVAKGIYYQIKNVILLNKSYKELIADVPKEIIDDFYTIIKFCLDDISSHTSTQFRLSKLFAEPEIYNLCETFLKKYRKINCNYNSKLVDLFKVVNFLDQLNIDEKRLTQLKIVNQNSFIDLFYIMSDKMNKKYSYFVIKIFICFVNDIKEIVSDYLENEMAKI